MSRQVNPLRLWPNTRVILVGQTGSGKSTLARYLLLSRERVIVIDPKAEMKLEDYEDVEPERLARRIGKIPKLIYKVRESKDREMEIEDVLDIIFSKGQGYLVYIDELYLLSKSALNYPPSLRALYTQGRSRDISVMACTQRPAHVPLFCLSECQQYYKFQLRLRKDQERMAEFMGPEVLEPKDYPNSRAHSSYHSFYYYEPGMPSAKEYTLKIGGK